MPFYTCYVAGRGHFFPCSLPVFVFLPILCLFQPSVTLCHGRGYLQAMGDTDMAHCDPQQSPWLTLSYLCPYLPHSFSSLWKCTRDTLRQAPVDDPEDGIGKPLPHCLPFRVAEDTAVWFNSAISTSVPGRHSSEKRLHTMLILARFLKS